MMLKKCLAIAALSLPGMFLHAQSAKAPESWFTLDPGTNQVNGTGADEALKRLKAKGKKGETIIVAVLDSGVDYKHEDLKDVMWVNPGEIPNNGKDDDNNGYVDDIHGWNFLGGKDGQSVNHETLELTREYAKLSKKYGKDATTKPSGVSAKDWAYYQEIKTKFEEKRTELEADQKEMQSIFDRVDKSFAAVAKALNKKDFTAEDVATLKESTDTDVKEAVELVNKLMAQGVSPANLEEVKAEQMSYVNNQLNYNYNPDYNPRTIVGDNPEDLSSRFYGNNDPQGPDALHGTHVAGIIAAKRDNGKGMNGVADNVRIMSVRCVPDGDERDKDVANAIRYAVDNGASIINMSFGKAYSPQKWYVDEAVRYAQAHDVLLVHAAGNDAENNDTDPNFPNDKYSKKKLFGAKNAKTWMEIGALSWKTGEKRVAGFSNYGKANVDLFSPGVAIYATTPGNEYAPLQGTSMASPAAAGVAAILRSYFPDLSAKQVKEIMMNSVEKQSGDVIKPGTTDKVPFNELCVSGGIVSATKAIQAAETVKGQKVGKATWRTAGAAAAKAKPVVYP